MQIIGAGFGRAGTMSLTAALEQLGYMLLADAEPVAAKAAT